MPASAITALRRVQVRRRLLTGVVKAPELVIHGPMKAVSAVVVNQEYAERGRVLMEGDEVAILPPVSGGQW